MALAEAQTLIPARKNRGSPLFLILLLAGCAAVPSALPTVASPTSNAPISSESTPPAPTSNEPISLEGHILLGLGTVSVARADGTDRQQVHPPGAYCCATRISPDHTLMLAMPGTDETGAVRGGMLSLDGSEFELLPQPDPTLNLVPQVWSPDGDGSRILFVEERLQPTGALWTARPDGTDRTKVYEDPDGHFVRGAVWSPDGSQIMFSLDPISDTFQHPETNAVYAIYADGTGLTLVADDPGFKGVSEWWQ